MEHASWVPTTCRPDKPDIYIREPVLVVSSRKLTFLYQNEPSSFKPRAATRRKSGNIGMTLRASKATNFVSFDGPEWPVILERNKFT